jgi:hypothetical protein
LVDAAPLGERFVQASLACVQSADVRRDGSAFLERLCSGNAGEPFAAIGDELPAVARLLDYSARTS